MTDSSSVLAEEDDLLLSDFGVEECLINPYPVTILSAQKLYNTPSKSSLGKLEIPNICVEIHTQLMTGSEGAIVYLCNIYMHQRGT